MAQFGPGKGHGPAGRDDFGRAGVTGQTDDRYQFRTPSLLNVELGAPYGHAGQFRDLEDIVRHYRNAADSLRDYDIAAELDDASLVGTLVDNKDQVLARLDNRVAQPRNFDTQAVLAFLGALTADGARDLSDVVPQSVPSGLAFDQ